MDEQGFVITIYIVYETKFIKDDTQYLLSDKKARCRLCGEHVATKRIFSREAEAQHVADKIRIALMTGEDPPDGCRFNRG